MSATVYIRVVIDGELITPDTFASRKVPDANHAVVTEQGYLRLYTSEGWGSTKSDCGLFKEWDHVVIEPRQLRDSNGRFMAKEPR